MARFQKWVADARPEQAVLGLARYTLQVWLAAVQYYLPLAAEKADKDMENVHQQRVSSRRATAAVTSSVDSTTGQKHAFEGP
jgi:hypothetical protein